MLGTDVDGRDLSVGGSMKCTRCHGVMEKERLYDLLENDAQVYVAGWHWGTRCVACGHVSEWVAEQMEHMADTAVTVRQADNGIEAG